ncbi:hypothetical protein GYMLUDRAFT_779478 [Collybiopsis luxurians FD-317 M1]|uniref:Uncharacterized protein n=1 Tax=Collybiopsis luxurians FD-317 M1 TaxID=944289 RepID=A0A0D0C2T3_9AGAR|nr:hypothetical protein GYMLUDRAFT_779478 [Collybiopsis luxurians FD-317 M1]
MSANDLAVILGLGAVIKHTVIGYIIVSILFGLYIGASGFAIYFIMNRLQNWPQQIALSIQLCLSAVTICTFLTACAGGFLEVQMILIETNNSNSLGERAAAYDASKVPVLLSFKNINALSGHINVLIGDILVFWRAWAIWHGNKFVQWMLIIFALSNAVFIILSTVWNWNLSDASDETFGSVFKYTVFLFFSLISNIFVTLAIAYRAWTTDMFGNHYPSPLGRTQVQKVILFMVESGMIFCILQIAYYAMAMVALTKNQTDFSPSYDLIVKQLGAMILPFYPTLVFIVSYLIGRSG